MSVHFVSGKPGGGKSLYGVRLVADALAKTSKCIITNLSIKLGELNAYLQENYPDLVIDLHRRLRILTEDETGIFWLFRPPRVTTDELGEKCEWVQLKALTEAEEKAGVRLDFSPTKGLPGVLYVIDEIHIYFNSREWMKTGKMALYYLSQHRKLGDDVLCITQSINNVDKQFRSVAQDFTYLTNLRKTKLLKFFTMPSLFMWQTFLEPASANSSSMETGTFTLDVSGLAKCYDTAAGVGIQGVMADKEEKPKGVPWWLLVLVPIAIWIGVWYLPAIVSRVVGRVTSVRVPAQVGAVPAAATTNGYVTSPMFASVNAATTNGPAANQASQAFNSAGLSGHVQTAPQEEVWLTGMAQNRGLVTVWLSDGRTYTSRDRELTFVGPNFVIISQVVYRFRSPRPAADGRILR